MTEQPSANAIIRKRMRRMAGQLTEDSSLRSYLTDEQAQRALDWGMALVEETAVKTVSLPDDDASPVLEERVTAVRTTLQLVNRLMGEPPTSDRIEEQLTRLLKNLAALTGQITGYPHLRRAEKFKRAHAEQDKVAAFNALHELLEGKFGDEPVTAPETEKASEPTSLPSSTAPTEPAPSSEATSSAEITPPSEATPSTETTPSAETTPESSDEPLSMASSEEDFGDPSPSEEIES